MRSYTLLSSVLLWTLLALVSTKPTESEVEDFIPPGNFNETDDSIMPQPRFVAVSNYGKTYRLYFAEVNWFTAMEYCSFYGQTLASINSSGERNLLRKVAFLNGKYYYATAFK